MDGHNHKEGYEWVLYEWVRMCIIGKGKDEEGRGLGRAITGAVPRKPTLCLQRRSPGLHGT